MSWFPDLSSYEYGPGEPHILNIGWLENGVQYNRGPVTLPFVHELTVLASNMQAITRGLHYCGLCIPPADIIAMDPSYEFVWEKFRSGNGEIRVTSSTGIEYSAPSLIVHYITEHQYQPPKEFIDAVLFHRKVRTQKKAE